MSIIEIMLTATIMIGEGETLTQEEANLRCSNAVAPMMRDIAGNYMEDKRYAEPFMMVMLDALQAKRVTINCMFVQRKDTASAGPIQRASDLYGSSQGPSGLHL